MPQAMCAHCNVEITDRSSMVERGGRTYCCNNCATATTAAVQQSR